MEKWKPSVSVTAAEIMETDTENNSVKISCKPQNESADQNAVKGNTADQSAVKGSAAGQSADRKSAVQAVRTDTNNVTGAAEGSQKYANNITEESQKHSCDLNAGTLPYPCAPMAFPYIPMQGNHPVRYSRMEALETGTLFPGLNLPFKAAIQARTKLSNTALVELMALDFAVQELGLYLTTHADDQEALQLYWSYLQLAKEGRERYERQYGPVLQSDPTPESGYIWLNDPWPWDPDET